MPIAFLRRAKQFVNQDTLINMFNALVLPHFTYCSNVWSDGSCTHIEKLTKLHQRAARVITGSSYEIRSTEIFQKLELEKMETILKKLENIMTFKALRGETPNYLSDFFISSHNDAYQLRSNDRKLYLTKLNTNFLKKSFHTAELHPGIIFLMKSLMHAISFPCLLLRLC